MPYDPSPARRHMARMGAYERIAFTVFRIQMMARYHVPDHAFNAENVVDRCLQEWLTERGHRLTQTARTEGMAIYQELIDMGWGPITDEAKATEREVLRNAARNTPQWRG